jgi:hypothetical protein
MYSLIILITFITKSSTNFCDIELIDTAFNIDDSIYLIKSYNKNT